MADDPQRTPGAGENGQVAVSLAVYDFDGTLLAGKSPVILMRHLLAERSLKISTGVSIGLWGLAYKLHLPVGEAWVRERVFRAFAGRPREEVDRYLFRFYDEDISHRLRQSMLQQIGRDRREGCVIVTVSATFEPIVARMASRGIVDYAIGTRMQVDARGRYTDRVDGSPVAGQRKLLELRRFADGRFGEGCWRISRAYSDHYSDKPLLYAADEACVVNPDNGLRSAAKRNGWRIVER